jgi:hypothetical protein
MQILTDILGDTNRATLSGLVHTIALAQDWLESLDEDGFLAT